MAADSVEFYEKLKTLREQQQDNERQRLLLEQQRSSNASSDKKINMLKISQLQNYWRKICEDEKRSQRRNEQLLKDLDRIDEHVSRLAERSDKLRKLKHEYEAYIEKTYPNWKEKVLHRQLQQTAASSAHERHQLIQDHTGPDRLVQPHTGMKNINQQPTESVQQNYGVNGTIQSMQASDGVVQPLHGITEFMKPEPLPYDNVQQHLVSNRQQQGGQNETSQHHPEPEGVVQNHPIQTIPMQKYSMSDDLPKFLPSTELPGQNNAKSDSSYRAVQEFHNADVPYRAADGFESNSLKQEGEHGALPGVSNSIPANPMRNLANGHASRGLEVIYEASNQASVKQTSVPDSVHTSVISSPTKDPIAKDRLATDHSSDLSHGKVNVYTSVISSPTKDPISKDRLATDRSSDLSKGKGNVVLATEKMSDIQPSPEKQRKNQKTKHEDDTKFNETDGNAFKVPDALNDNNSNRIDAIETRKIERSFTAPRPDVSVQGFCRMLLAVEDEVSMGRSAKFYFKSTSPPTPVVQEIIRTANRGGSFSHLNLESIAMVILEQLPCLSLNTKNLSVFTDQMLASLIGDVDNDVLRAHLDPSDHILWDSLYDHFLVLLRYAALSSGEISEIFSPLLIGGNSRMLKQAVTLVKNVLDAIPSDDLNDATPNSTSDFSFLSPRKPTDSAVDEPLMNSSIASVRQLNEEETAAYKQLLASTTASHKLIEVESGDDDDEIEKNLSQHLSESRIAKVIGRSDEILSSPKSTGSLKSPKSPKDPALLKIDSSLIPAREVEFKNNFAHKTASLKSGRSTVENIISQAEDNFDLDDDIPIHSSSAMLSKDGKVKAADDNDDDDFWA